MIGICLVKMLKTKKNKKKTIQLNVEKKYFRGNALNKKKIW